MACGPNKGGESGEKPGIIGGQEQDSIADIKLNLFVFIEDTRISVVILLFRQQDSYL